MPKPRTLPRYTRSQRPGKMPTVRKDLEARFGDKTERRERNLREPFIGLDPDNKHRLLPDGKTRGQGWNAIRAGWFSFRIYKSKGDIDGMIKAAHSIRREQANLGIALSEFTDPIILTESYITQEEIEYHNNELKEKEEEEEEVDGTSGLQYQ